MADSDDELTAPTTNEKHRVVKGIQDAVRQHFQESGDAESLTVNNIRSRAELNLNLDKDFLRTDPYWRNESKVIIREEFERQNDAIEEAGKSPAAPPKVPKRKRTAAPVKKQVEQPEPSDEDEPAKKPSRRQRGKAKPKSAQKAVPIEVDEELSELDDEPPTSKKRSRAKANAAPAESVGKSSQTKTPDPEFSDVEMKDVGHEDEKPTTEGTEIVPQEEQTAGIDSESELSEVLDITPKKKRQRTKGPAKSKSTSKTTPLKASLKGRGKKSKEDTPVDANTEKIKELQSWLLKCGVRKLWGKELAKFTTAKEKINHLKGLLTDIGMTGRYSNEKAKRIKEERELAADLEAVQEGAKVWGTDCDEAMKTRSARAAEAPAKTRKLVRAPELAFLDDQSDESD